ncbi:MAG TPA: DUF418 domain-containing protein [Pyrinomonadaceae bacterium]|nr:DUF418 domain-containing protein [Pyrinomonadaceae bacterium]
MSDDQLSPVGNDERIEVLDVLRGLAVCGILVGNMQWFSGYGMMPPSLAASTPLYDQVTHFLVHFIVEGKFYSIFSFLFGFGFAMQIARAAERGDTKASVFKLRLFWMLIIGLLHAYLVWAGDIVSIYALMGFVLLLFRKKSNVSLLKWAAIMLAIPVLTYTLLYITFKVFVGPETMAQMQEAQVQNFHQTVALVQQGSYRQLTTDYNLDYVIGRYAGLIFQMRLPKLLAMFLLGYYAYRVGVFQDPDSHRPFIRRVLVWGLVLGVVGNLLMATLAGNEAPFGGGITAIVGVFGYAFGVPALALGISALVLTLWQKTAWQKVLGFLAPVGRMALTNYLLQSVICVIIFYGYGFGLFGTVGALRATLMAFGIFFLQIVASTVWLAYFRYGPVEWIWRQLTYRRRMALRRSDVGAA